MAAAPPPSVADLTAVIRPAVVGVVIAPGLAQATVDALVLAANTVVPPLPVPLYTDIISQFIYTWIQIIFNRNATRAMIEEQAKLDVERTIYNTAGAAIRIPDNTLRDIARIIVDELVTKYQTHYLVPIQAGASIADVNTQYTTIQNKLRDLEPNITDKLRPDYIKVKTKVTAFNANIGMPATTVVIDELKTIMRDVEDIERKVNMFNIGRTTEEKINAVSLDKKDKIKTRPETAFDKHVEFTMRAGTDTIGYENVKKILESGILRSSKKRSPVIYVR